jgi:hypothetical protein
MAIRRGLEISKEYLDSGQSGAKRSRPALDEMLNDARRGKFRVLLCWRLDRLGRSTVHLLQLLENFRVWNVDLISYSEGLDFTTPSGRLMYTGPLTSLRDPAMFSRAWIGCARDRAHACRGASAKHFRRPVRAGRLHS